jgi:hypothetical protein
MSRTFRPLAALAMLAVIRRARQFPIESRGCFERFADQLP